MNKLNMVDVIKLKYQKYNQQIPSDISGGYVKNFVRGCENKLSTIYLDFDKLKSINNNYEFSKETAEYLIELEELNVKQSVDKVSKESYDKLDANIIDDYFRILTNIVNSHFTNNEREEYLRNIEALKREVELHKNKKLITLELFNTDDETNSNNELLQEQKLQWEALNFDLSKIVVDIASERKYPHLTAYDRDVLTTELFNSLTTVLVNHYKMLSLTNSIRASEDEGLKDMTIEQIIGDLL